MRSQKTYWETPTKSSLLSCNPMGASRQCSRARSILACALPPSPAIARHAIDHFGFENVHIGTLDTAELEKGSFDLITMWDVVEHVPEPRDLLEQARELLKPGGLLVIETQNVNSRFARLLAIRPTSL